VPGYFSRHFQSCRFVPNELTKTLKKNVNGLSPNGPGQPCCAGPSNVACAGGRSGKALPLHRLQATNSPSTNPSGRRENHGAHLECTKVDKKVKETMQRLEEALGWPQVRHASAPAVVRSSASMAETRSSARPHSTPGNEASHVRIGSNRSVQRARYEEEWWSAASANFFGLGRCQGRRRAAEGSLASLRLGAVYGEL
jgi:hypothetical protein